MAKKAKKDTKAVEASVQNVAVGTLPAPDQDARLGGAGMLREVPMVDIHIPQPGEPGCNPRGSQESWEAGLRQLEQTFVAGGKVLRDPLLVQECVIDGKTKYRLWDGFRRQAVCAKHKVKAVPCYVAPASANEADMRALQVALNSAEARSDINPAKQMRHLLQTVEMLRKAGYQECEERVRKLSGLSAPTWKRLMTLAKAPAFIVDKVENDGMSLAVAMTLVNAEGVWDSAGAVEKLEATLQRAKLSPADWTTGDVARARDAIKAEMIDAAEGEPGAEGEVSPAAEASNAAAQEAENELVIGPMKNKDAQALLDSVVDLVIDGVEETVDPYVTASAKTLEVDAKAALYFAAGAYAARKGIIPSIIPVSEDDTLPGRTRRELFRRSVERLILTGRVNRDADKMSEDGYNALLKLIEGEEGATGKGAKGLIDKQDMSFADKATAVIDGVDEAIKAAEAEAAEKAENPDGDDESEVEARKAEVKKAKVAS